jgi:hypothetical protein
MYATIMPCLSIVCGLPAGQASATTQAENGLPAASTTTAGPLTALLSSAVSCSAAACTSAAAHDGSAEMVLPLPEHNAAAETPGPALVAPLPHVAERAAAGRGAADDAAMPPAAVPIVAPMLVPCDPAPTQFAAAAATTVPPVTAAVLAPANPSEQCPGPVVQPTPGLFVIRAVMPNTRVCFTRCYVIACLLAGLVGGVSAPCSSWASPHAVSCQQLRDLQQPQRKRSQSTAPLQSKRHAHILCPQRCVSL